MAGIMQTVAGVIHFLEDYGFGGRQMLKLARWEGVMRTAHAFLAGPVEC